MILLCIVFIGLSEDGEADPQPLIAYWRWYSILDHNILLLMN